MKAKALDDFDEFKSESISNSSEDLQFTGNWFIDAGILGFVNLMEEVYNLSFDIVVSEKFNREDFYYAYFVYYIKKTSVDWIKRQELTGKYKKDENIKKQFNRIKSQLINEINRIKLSKQPSKVGMDVKTIRENIKIFNENIKSLIVEKFEKFKDGLNKPFGNNKKTILSQIDSIGFIVNEPFFQNLNFLNPSKNKSGKEIGILKSFEEMIYHGKIKSELTKNALDKTITKYLFSEKEFSNVFYGKITTIDDLDNMLNTRSSIEFLLCFPISFKRVYNRFILFYTPNLKITYEINKKLDVLLNRVEEESISLFKITWQAIIDYLVENKAKFSLENMYFIEYRSIQQQNLIGVEYIGIPKLQASILLEDPIRESLNINLQIDDDDWKWILEEFTKNKPLYPLILRHVQYCINKNKMVNRKTSLYALAINAKIKENNSIELFSSSFLKGYRSIVEDIKETYRNLSIQATNISKLFDSKEDRQKICYSLMAALKRRNRIAFTNILLKKFLEKSGLKEILYLNRFVFDKVTMKDASWENYALALVIGIWSFGGGDGGEPDLEE